MADIPKPARQAKHHRHLSMGCGYPACVAVAATAELSDVRLADIGLISLERACRKW